MKAGKLIERAREVSDLKNSDFITHDDEQNSLNEAYKDLYADITDADDDYFSSESTITLTAGMKQAGTDNEYLVPLPTDFWKLRYLDYRSNNRWVRMERFPLNLKNNLTGEPMYRMRGSNLWVIVGNFTSFGGQVKVGYYPQPAELSVPEASEQFGAGVTLALKPLITSPHYWAPGRTMLYVYNGVEIRAESADTRVTSLLLTAATTVKNLWYYKGYIYYIRAADIQRATSNLVSTISPAAITTLGNVVNFSIHHDLITLNDGTNFKTCNLDGTGMTTGAAVAADDMCYLQDAAHVYYLFYRSSGGAVVSGAFTIVASGIVHLVSDAAGEFLYVVDTDNRIRRLTVELVGFTVTEDLVLAKDDEGYIDPFLANESEKWLGTIRQDGTALEALSALEDTDLSYPLNALHESMAYQVAADFRRKQSADPGLQLARLSELRSTLLRQLKRDEYQVERIRNHYDVSANRGW